MSDGTKLRNEVGEDAVSAAVSKLIRDLEPGDRLPGERALAAKLNVSRPALRDRLTQLEGLGVLDRRTGSGTYVRELGSANLTIALDLAVNASRLSLDSLHSVRVALERQAAAEAAQRAESVPIAYMREAIRTMEGSSARGREIYQADLAFHQALFDATGNPALIFFADALRGVLHDDLAKRRRRMQRLPDDRKVMVEVHTGIYEAIYSGDPEAAMGAIDHHFDVINQRVPRR